MDKNLLKLLVCPLCKGPVIHDKDNKILKCMSDRLGFPIEQDIPIMLPHRAIKLSEITTDREK